MVVEEVSGNIFLRKHRGCPKGHVLDGHDHEFDHTTIVFIGAVHCKAKCPDGRIIERDFRAPCHFLVKAEVEHEITVLEEGTEFWCVYSHRTPQGEVVQEYTGWGAAYL
jgi:L-ascorbate metabolism protein UlaG (beta-lactamase superfamily)